MPTPTPTENDLNQIITTAVNARIEAQIAAALAGDEMIGQFVQAALLQPVERRNPDSYRTEKVSYLHNVLLNTIQEATKAAIAEAVEDEKESIREVVRKELRKRANAIAEGLVDCFADGVKGGYNVKIQVAAKESSW